MTTLAGAGAMSRGYTAIHTASDVDHRSSSRAQATRSAAARTGRAKFIVNVPRCSDFDARGTTCSSSGDCVSLSCRRLGVVSSRTRLGAVESSCEVGQVASSMPTAVIASPV